MNSISDKHIISQSFALQTLNQTVGSINDTMNGSIQSEESFSFKHTTRQSVDFTLTNINPEQTALLRFKAAFQLYLKREEVIFKKYKFKILIQFEILNRENVKQ